MDVNGDGIQDVFSGSYTKGLFYFLGSRDGKYAKAQSLKHSDGSVVNPNSALGAKLYDWDADGDLDVVSGSIDGPVYFIRNEGGLKFGKAVELTSNGQPISAADAGVCFGDFDRDGVLDLVVGGDNLMIFSRAKAGGTELGAPLYVVKNDDPWAEKKLKDANTLVLATPTTGVRLKPCVTDWNGDGKIDILAGDYTSVMPPQKSLTAAEKQELEGLKKKAETFEQRMDAEYARLEKLALEKIGVKDRRNMTEAQQSEYQRVFFELFETDKQYTKLMEEWQTLYQRISVLEGSPQSHGFVWVFLQK